MIKRKQKRILVICIITMIVTVFACGTIYFLNNNNQAEEILEQIDFSSKRLIVVTDGELEETYNAKSSNKLYTGEYVLKYETEDDAIKAYENFINDEKIKSVKVDINVDIKLHNIDTQTIIHNISGIQSESWGTYTMGLNETQDILNAKTEKEEVVVAVIDSGFDLTLPILTEQNLLSRIDNNYINITNNTKNIEDNYSIENPDTGEKLLIGHGTHVGGTILDATPNNVKILPIKCEDDEGSIGLIYMQAAIRYAIDHNADVINMSLGWENDPTLTEINNAIKSLVEEANQAGIIVVAAVGNGDEDGIRTNGENLYPAAYDKVIGVGSLKTDIIRVMATEEGEEIDEQSYILAKNSQKENLSYSTFSNYGTTVDFVAPGECILSLVPTGSVVQNSPILDGTSMASPHIAATVATIKTYNKDLKYDQIYEILKRYSEDLGTTGKDTDYGEGMPCFKNYTECICGCETCNKIYCFGCSCTNCAYSTVHTKTLEGIEIKTNPNKTTYIEGESFDKTGMVVEAVYSDNSRQTITNYTYSPEGALTKSNTTIVISYEEGGVTKTTSLTITVNENTPPTPPPQTKTLERIEIKINPNKMTYIEGESFDKTGMVVEAVYSDNSRQTITNYTYSPEGALTKSNTTIVISYEEGGVTKTTSLTITVNENTPPTPPPQTKTLERIEIKTNPNKTTYTEGESFDKTGMVVEAVYSDGSKIEITNYNCFPTTALTANHTKVIIAYTENGKTVTTDVPVTVKSKTVNSNGNGNANQGNNNQGQTQNPNQGNNNQGQTQNSNNQTQQGNSQNIDTKVEVPKTDKIVQTIPTDNTTKDGTIANTGIETYILPIIIISAIGITSFIKYRKYKDI